MEIIPAIDLKDGACVRLYQGDFEQTTVFSDDPAETALRWQRAGTSRIHVVDLDGTRYGAMANLASIRAIVDAVSVPIQVGGGVRTAETAQALLEAGVERVVLGTAAVENPELVKQLCLRWGQERVVVAVDARQGRVAIRGWTEETSVDATELVKEMAVLGPRRFLYTDISRDGTMTAPNFEAVGDLVESTRMEYHRFRGGLPPRRYKQTGSDGGGGGHCGAGHLRRFRRLNRGH